MKIKDVLELKDSKIFSVKKSMLVTEAIKIMVDKDIGSVIVLEKEKMIGKLTFREIISAINNAGGILQKIKVESIMVRNPVSASVDDSLIKVRKLMTDQHIRYLPIYNDKKLFGVISFHDIAKAQIKITSHENVLLKKYIKNWPSNT